ncbi:ABC transporter substrate-binding protein [Brevibacterium marinum]|uniref:Iron complex transport system substrate-binding protein n=1 Tax=Brevibacterium marinum TaxID=418643 RepID=A0A846S5J9_9MICO|nr:iron complex transport system substrate-binding protein [Brevibacterium marinum]
MSTEQGEIDVPADPKRVVVLNYALAGYLFDLGEQVVATTPEVTDSTGEYSRFWSERAEAQGTEFLPWSSDGFDLEAIIAADPDLIVAGGIGFPLKHAKDAYARLTEVAPTVIVSGEEESWQGQFSFIAAEVLGREDDYERFESAYEDRVAEVKANIAVPAGEVSVLTLDRADTPYILIEGTSLSAELERLGFATAPLFRENDIEPYTAGGDTFGPSLEVLPDVLRSETVFVVGFNNANIGVDDLEREAPYNRVPAFASGQAYDLPYWAIRGDYDEALALLDTIEAKFRKNR